MEKGDKDGFSLMLVKCRSALETALPELLGGGMGKGGMR